MEIDKRKAVRSGIELARRGRYKDALTVLEADMAFTADPLAMAHYGYLVALVEKQYGQGLSYCQIALKKAPRDPDIKLNLGKVYLLNGDKYFAIRTFNQGLVHSPDHKGLGEVFVKLGVRRAPAIPFLGRSNPVNKLIGRATYNIGKKFRW